MEEEKKKTSPSMMLDSSLLSDSVSKLQLSPSPSATTEQKPDWSLLPEELLQLIPTHMENSNSCSFGAIHARSVCRSWRSTCPFPSRQSHPLPPVSRYSGPSTLEKIPLFLFRVKTPPMSPSEYFLGGIAREDHHTELLPSPIQCSVKVNLPGSDPVLMNMLDCQILPLGHRYRLIGWDPREDKNPPVAFLPLNEDGRGGRGFVVLLNYSKAVLKLTSSSMKWTRFKRLSHASCHHLFTFRGKFHAVLLNGDVFVISPYDLMEAVPLMLPQDLNSTKYLVPSGDDEELFLVEKIIATPGVLDFGRSACCRVSRLDEEAGEWVVVTDLGDRVLFIGQLGNVSCSGKDLPDGCGLTGNSVLFTNEPVHVSYAYRYGAETGDAEGDSLWRLSRESRVLVRSRSPPVVALRVESPKPNWSLLPEKLLQLISTHLENNNCCFFIDAIHARSVCSSWQSAFPLPVLNQSHDLPFFTEFTRGMLPIVRSCTLKKFPLFLFSVRTQTTRESSPPPSEFFLGGICREDDMEVLSPYASPQRPEYVFDDFGRDDESEDDYPEFSRPSPPESFLGGIGQEDHHTELSSPFQCTVKADFPEYHPILTNMRDCCQILPLGHYYKVMGSYPENTKRGVAFLPLNKEKNEFAVLLNSLGFLLVLRSSEEKWIQIERTWSGWCKGLCTFRRKFYATFQNGEIFVIDPYNNPMEATPLTTPQDLDSSKYLVPSGNDEEELFLVVKTITTCRLSKLDEETGKWVVVSSLGDRVLIIGQLGNFVFPVKEFPDGCGLSRDSILITDDRGSNVTFAYKYDDLGFWRLSNEDRVLIRSKSPPVLALRVDRVRNRCFL